MARRRAVDDSARAPKKGAASGEMPGGGAGSRRTRDPRMGTPATGKPVASGAWQPQALDGNPPNGNILVGGGREINRDPLSRGDRKGDSPNQTRRRRAGGDVGLQGPRLGVRPPAGRHQVAEVGWKAPPQRVIGWGDAANLLC